MEWRQEEGSGIRDGEEKGGERRGEEGRGRGRPGDSQLAFACALNRKLIGPARLARVFFCLFCFVFVFSFLVSPAGCKTSLLYFFFLFFPVSPASLCLFPRSGSEIGSTKLAVG